MAKKVAVLGGSKDQLPLIRHASERSYYVIVLDSNPNCMAKAYADTFIQVSIRDSDKVIETLQSLEVEAIASMISEAGVLTIHKACQALRLPNPYSEKSALATYSKQKMRHIFDSAGIENIPYLIPKNSEQLKKFSRSHNNSIVLKLSESGGQRGLRFIRNHNELEDFISQANDLADGNTIAERFEAGDEINCVFIVYSGRVKDLIISDRLKDEKVFGVVRRHVYPSKYTETHHAVIFDFCQRITDALDIQNGIVFPQFIIDRDSSRPHLLELGVRVPGGIMDRLTSYALGIDLVQYTLDISLGKIKNYDNYRNYPIYQNILVTFFNGSPGALRPTKLVGIKVSSALNTCKNILEHGLFTQSFPDVEIFPLKDGSTRFYYCISVGESFDEAHQYSRIFYDGIDFLSIDSEVVKLTEFDFNRHYLV